MAQVDYQQYLEQARSEKQQASGYEAPTQKPYNAAVEAYKWMARNSLESPLPSQQSYWERPSNVVKAYNDITARPDEDWAKLGIDRAFVTDAYNRLNQYNNTIDWTQWKALPTNDPYTEQMKAVAMPDLSVAFDVPYQPDWNKVEGLPPAFPNQDILRDPGIPTYQKVLATMTNNGALQGMAMALPYMALGGMAGFAIGNVPGALLGAVGGLAMGALLGFTGDPDTQEYARQRLLAAGYNQASVDRLQTGFNLTLRALNIPAEFLERGVGTTTTLAQPLQDILPYKIFGYEDMLDEYLKGKTEYKRLLDNLDAVWEASRLTYEAASTEGGFWGGPAAAAANIPAGIEYLAESITGTPTFRLPGKGEVYVWGQANPVKLDTYGQGIINAAINDLIAGKNPQKVFEKYTSMTGISGMFGDLLFQSLADPYNIVPFFERAGIRAVAKWTGNVHLEWAGKIAQGEGVVGTLREYGQLLRERTQIEGVNAPFPSEMSRFQRYVARVTPEGIPLEMRPGLRGTAGKILYGGLTFAEAPLNPITWWKSLTELTPRAKFSSLHNLTNSNMGEWIGNHEGTADEIVADIKKLTGEQGVTIQDAAGIARNFDNPDAYVTIVALKGFDQQADLLHTTWTAATPHREIAARIAEATGENYWTMLQRLKDGSVKELNTIFNEVTAKVQAAAASQDPNARVQAEAATALLRDPRFTPEFLKSTQMYAKNNDFAFDLGAFKAKLLLDINQHMVDWAAKAYGIEPDPVLLRAGNAFKKLQSLLLLGFSPSFGLTNLAGNISTSAAEGVYGFIGPEKATFYQEFLGHPEAQVGAGWTIAGEMGTPIKQQYATYMEAYQAEGERGAMAWIADHSTQIANEAMRTKDTIQKWNDKLGTGPVQKLSGRVESASSMAVHYTWTMGTQKRLWNRNASIPTMPDSLHAALERIQPGLADLVMTGIESANSKTDISRILGGVSMLARTCDPYIETTVKALGMDSAMTRDMLARSNIREKINSRMAAGLTPEEAIASVSGDAMKILQANERARIRSKVEEGSARVAGEGLAAVVQPFGDAAWMFEEHWTRHWEFLENTWELAEQMVGPEKNRFISQRLAQLDGEWVHFTDADTALYKSMLRALGLVRDGNLSPHAQLFIDEMSGLRSNWRKFYQERTKRARQVLSNYDKMSPDEREAAWAQFRADMGQLYAEYGKAELASYRTMGMEFIKAWREKNGNRGLEAVAYWWKRQYDANQMRQTLMADYRKYLAGEEPQTPEIRAAIDSMNGGRLTWPEFVHRVYLPAIGEITKATLDGVNAMADASVGQRGPIKPEWQAAYDWFYPKTQPTAPPPTTPPPAGPTPPPTTPPPTTPPVGAAPLQTPPPTTTPPPEISEITEIFTPEPTPPPTTPSRVGGSEEVIRAAEAAEVDEATRQVQNRVETDNVARNVSDGIDESVLDKDVIDAVQRTLETDPLVQTYDWQDIQQRREALVDLFGVPEAEVDNFMKYLDYTADNWGRRNNRNPSEYWDNLVQARNDKGPNVQRQERLMQMSLRTLGEVPIRIMDEPLYQFGKKREGAAYVWTNDPETGGYTRVDVEKWQQPDYVNKEWNSVRKRLADEMEQYELLCGEITEGGTIMPIDGADRRVLTAIDLQRALEQSVLDGTVAKLLDPTQTPEQLAVERGLEFSKSETSPYQVFLSQVKALRKGYTLIESKADGHITKNGKVILSNNGKASASVDFILGTCQPTINCRECYAAKGMIRKSLIKKSVRNTLLMMYDPINFGRQVAAESKKVSKTDLPFIRLLGSGDLTSGYMIDSFNELARNADRPIHIFSRHHENLAQLKGTGDAPFIKMGSIDTQLARWIIDKYGKDYLINNLKERGINNAFLYADEAADLPLILELHREGAIGLVFSASHKLQDTLRAYPDLYRKSCPCDAGERSFFASCRQCALSQAGCFMVYSELRYNPTTGEIVRFVKDPETGQYPPTEVMDSTVPFLSFVKNAKLTKAQQAAGITAKEVALANTNSVLIWKTLDKLRFARSKFTPTPEAIAKGAEPTKFVTINDIMYPGHYLRLVDEDTVAPEDRQAYMEKVTRDTRKRNGYEEHNKEKEEEDVAYNPGVNQSDFHMEFMFAPRDMVRAQLADIIMWYEGAVAKAKEQGTYYFPGGEVQIPVAGREFRRITSTSPEAMAEIAAVAKELEPDWINRRYDMDGRRLSQTNNGITIRVDPTTTPEFRRFFGDSQAVTEEGTPLPLYHGTTRDFQAFDVNAPRATDEGFYGKGVYLSPNPEMASDYATRYTTQEAEYPIPGGNIMPLYARVEHPFKTWDQGTVRRRFGETAAEQTANMKKAGYDGVFRYNDRNQLQEVVVFDDVQVKSPFNRGTYDINNPNILQQTLNEESRAYYQVDGLNRLIGALKGAAPDSAMHELAHYHFEFGLTEGDRAIVRRYADSSGYARKWLNDMVGKNIDGYDITMEVANRVYKEKSGVLWSRAVQEAYADGYVQWTATGTLPKGAPEGLRAVFYRFRTFMRQILSDVLGPGKVPGMPLNNEMVGVFRRVLTMDPWETPHAADATPDTIKAHADSIREALRQGLDVSQEVLAQHPEIVSEIGTKLASGEPLPVQQVARYTGDVPEAATLADLYDASLAEYGWEGGKRHLFNSLNKHRMLVAINEKRQAEGKPIWTSDDWTAKNIPQEELDAAQEARYKSMKDVPFREVRDWLLERTSPEGRPAFQPQRPITSIPKYQLEMIDSARQEYKSRGRNRDDWVRAAINRFGTTNDPLNAAYILNDGRMLDFSGQNEGGTPGIRAFDHRQIAEISEDIPEAGNVSMTTFATSTESIRMDYSRSTRSLNIEIFGVISNPQMRTLRNMPIDEVFFDISRPDGVSLVNGYFRIEDGGELSKLARLAKDVFTGTGEPTTPFVRGWRDEFFQPQEPISYSPDDSVTVQKYHETRLIAGKRVVGATYVNGRFAAYIPFNFNTTRVFDTSQGPARILGIDPDGNYVYRLEETGEVKSMAPGQDNVEVSGPYAPSTMESSGAVNTDESQLWYDGMANWIQPFMDELAGQMRRGGPVTSEGMNLNRLSTQDQAVMKRWIEQVAGEYSKVKQTAIRVGDLHRNLALLDYSNKYNYDNWLGLVFPYQFWFTRSMVNWALRMVDRPGFMSFFARLASFGNDETDERFKNIPSRLRGKVRIPMPFLNSVAPWAGGAIYVDPWGKLFNFREFLRPWERYVMTENAVKRKAEQLIYDWMKNGEYTQAEVDQALDTRAGALWNRAFAQAQEEEGGDAVDYLNLLSSPNLALSLAIRGPERVGPLPISRMMQGMAAVTGWDGLAKMDPEAMIRRQAKVSEFGEWGDYYIDRQISNMAGEGLISAEEAQIAMIERTGPTYDTAMERARMELAIREPSLLPFLAARNALSGDGNILDVLGSALVGWLPGGLLPEGELKLRGLYDDYRAASAAKRAGDEEAFNNFFKLHPEYEARLALFDKPEDRLHEFLVSQVWDKYTGLPEMYRGQATKTLGDDFVSMFLNQETADTDGINNETLASWAVQLGGYAPKGSAPAGVQPITFQGGEAATQYEQMKGELFPGIDDILDVYWNASYDQRAMIEQQYPMIRQYFNWRDVFIAGNPELIPYAVARDPELSQASPETAYQVYMFRSEKARIFPNISQIIDEYYALPSSDRKVYSNKQMVGQYYDWERDMLKKFPSITPYVKGTQSAAKTMYGKEYTDQYGTPIDVYSWPAEIQTALMGYYIVKKPLSNGAQSYLYYQWEQSGKQFGSFDRWLKTLGVYYGR